MTSYSTDLQERTETAVEVRGDTRVTAVVGALASVVAIAYLARVVGGGGWLDWALMLVVGAVAVAHLQALVDARVPLLVVDPQGVRLRRGRTWHGLPWSDIECLEHEPRRGLLHDGRVVLVPRDPDAAPLAVRLTLSTRVVGADGDLTAAVGRLAADPAQVVEIVDAQPDEAPEVVADLDEHPLPLDEPVDVAAELDHDHGDDHDDHDDERPSRLRDPRPAIARGIGYVAEHLRLRLPPVEEPSEPEPAVDVPPLVAGSAPLPLRDPVGGVRAEIRSDVRFEGAAALQTDPADDEDETTRALPEAVVLRRGAEDPERDLGEKTVVWDHRVTPIATPGPSVEPLVIDDLAPAPAPDPVVGPEIAAARTRLSLTVDDLATRTRIRPHVIESIEVDDFAPCGGDFYARGHLRTLARVLGIDAAPLLAAYDERYADAPIDARRVFEAELATGEGGPIRGTRGGPNWSVLVAAVMAVVLAWSIVRLLTDSPVELHSTPVLNGSPSGSSKLAPAVPVVLDAAAGGAHVVVRDGAGQIVFNGDLAFGDSRTVKAAPPVRVQSSDGGLKVTVDGQDRGPLGADGQPAQNTFAAAQ